MDKKQIYESIMKQVSKEIKKALKENISTDAPDNEEDDIDKAYFSFPSAHIFNGPANFCIDSRSGIDYAMIYPDGTFYFFSTDQYKNLLNGHKILLKKVQKIKKAINDNLIDEDNLSENDAEYAYLDDDEIAFIITQLEEIDKIPKGYWTELSGQYRNNLHHEYSGNTEMPIFGYKY